MIGLRSIHRSVEDISHNDQHQQESLKTFVMGEQYEGNEQRNREYLGVPPGQCLVILGANLAAVENRAGQARRYRVLL